MLASMPCCFTNKSAIESSICSNPVLIKHSTYGNNGLINFGIGDVHTATAAVRVEAQLAVALSKRRNLVIIANLERDRALDTHSNVLIASLAALEVTEEDASLAHVDLDGRD